MTSREKWHADVQRTANAMLSPGDFAFAINDGVRAGEASLGRHDLYRAMTPTRGSGQAIVITLKPRARPRF
jgi:hypothetical protein